MSAAGGDAGDEDFKKSALMHKIVTSAKKKIEESEKVVPACPLPTLWPRTGTLHAAYVRRVPAPLRMWHK